MVRHSRLIFVAALSLLLVACPRPQRPVQPPQPEQPILKPVPGAQALDIMPQESWVRILVYRGGTLAQMGHNHVIASHDLHGKVYLHPELKRSAFEVIMPVKTLQIDELELRRREGEGFAAEVPESAKQGTRKNMLSEALLDGEHYPEVRLISSAIDGTEEKLTAHVRVGVKDKWHELAVPMKLKKQQKGLTAAGEFKVTHAALGLEPFSAGFGALKVQDEMTIKFELTAR